MKRKLLLILSLCLIIACSVFFVACNGGGDNNDGNDDGNTSTHTEHTYKSEKWVKVDESGHALKCDDCDYIDLSSKESHNELGSDSACSKCGYKESKPPVTQKKVYDMSGVIFGDMSVKYDGEAHSIEATHLPDGVTATYDGNEQIEVGTYTITAHFIGDSENYEAIPDKTATLTITKATYDMSKVVFENLTVEYDGEAHSIEAINLPDGVTATYEGNGQTKVGEYEITAHFTGDSKNYEPIPDKTVTLTITKATYDMSEVVFADLTVVYDGEAHSIEATHLPDGVTATYDGNEQIEVGTYTITAHFIGDSENYEAIPDKTAILTITKATYDMSGVVFEDLIVVYDGEAHSIEATHLPDGVTATYDGNEQIEVGTYTITAHFNGDSENYEEIKDMTAMLIIRTPSDVNDFTFEFNSSNGGYYIVTGYTGSETDIAIPDMYKGYPITEIASLGGGVNCWQITSIVIPRSITSIGESVFTRCFNLQNVTFEENSRLTSIGDYTFSGSLMEKITIPKSVTSIGEYAFYGCNNLTSIIFEENSRLTTMGDGVFRYCGKLEKIEIPSGITSIGNYAFEDCNSLVKITIPSSVTSIGSYAFRYCSSLKNIEIPSEITSIGGYVFDGCDVLKYNEYNNALYLGNKDNPYVILIKAKDANIVNCIINDNTKIIGYSAFRGCDNLLSATFEEDSQLVRLCDNAFYGCNKLEKVEIPRGVTNIGFNTFFGCSNLTGVYITDIAAWCKILFSTNANPLMYAHNLYLNGELITKLTIPSEITQINSYTFRNCTCLVEIEIHGGITSIDSDAFMGCGNLNSISVAKGNGFYHSENNCLIETATSTLIRGCNSSIIPYGVTSIGSYAFSGCNSLKEITIPSSVTSIGSYAFYGCSNLSEITIPNGVTSIGEYAFAYCHSITSIEIPYTVTTIGIRAFAYCEALNTVYWNATTCNFGYSAYLLPPPSENLAINGIFSGSALTSVIIGENVLNIPYSTFDQCYSLMRVTFGENSQLTSIGEYAFRGCSSLIEITIPGGVTLRRGKSRLVK